MDLLCVAQRGRGENNTQQIEPRTDGKTNTITSVQKDNMVLQIKEATTKGFTEIAPGECFDFENQNSATRRGRKMEDKANCLMATSTTNLMNYTPTYRIRRLTPIEVCRLQTISDTYFYYNNGKQIVSDSAIYKTCGNGWTVDVISYLLKFLQL